MRQLTTVARVDTVAGFTRVQWRVLLAFSVLTGLTWWNAPWPAEQAMHHSLTLVALVGLAWVQRRYRLPLPSFLLVLAFLALHTLAARWIYSFVHGWRARWCVLAAVEIVLSTSALYELFEWGIAVTLAPGAAEAYNGQQGDAWDGQKDMALALAGGIVGATIAALRRRPAPRASRAGRAD